MALKKRQKLILSALSELGGEATTRQIAEKLNLNVNGVSQSLSFMKQVVCLGGRGGEIKWGLEKENSNDIKLAEAKLVLHHDDPPCAARLDNGFCHECNFTPDMQSTCFYFYCPICDVPLKKMACPKCGQTFKRPDR